MEKPTSRAPCEGGLLISLRCSTESWLFTRSAVDWSDVTICSAPTRSPYSPAFFAKLCAHKRHYPLLSFISHLPGTQVTGVPDLESISQPMRPGLNLRWQILGMHSQRTNNVSWKLSLLQSLSTALELGPHRLGYVHTHVARTLNDLGLLQAPQLNLGNPAQ